MSSKFNRSAINGILKAGIYIIILIVIFFLCSGRLNIEIAWILFCIILINSFILTLMMDPDLIAERSGIPKDAKKWDIIPALIIGRIGLLISMIIAGLDIRYGWSAQLPLYLRITAFIFLMLGFFISDWAILTNNFFSGLVRIQKERGHTVVSVGPYSYVRHPGYLGTIFINITIPVILNSLWAIVPAVFVIIVTIIRTALEDKTLQDELNGYKAYTHKVHYRLVPGIW